MTRYVTQAFCVSELCNSFPLTLVMICFPCPEVTTISLMKFFYFNRVNQVG